MRTRRTATVTVDGCVADTLRRMADVLDRDRGTHGGFSTGACTVSVELVVEDDHGELEVTLDDVASEMEACGRDLPDELFGLGGVLKD